MMTVIDDPRAKLLIANHGRSVMIGLALAGVVALVVAAGIALTPPTTTATEQTDQQSIETTALISADVVDEEEWAGVSGDGSTYLIAASPVVDIEPSTTAPDGTTVTHEVTLQIEGTRDGDVFWNEEEVLVEDEATVDDGEATTETSIDVAELQERLAELEERLAGVGSVETTVHLRTGYDTGTYEGELTTTSEMEVTDRAYWFESSLADSDTRDTTWTAEETGSPNWLAVSLFGLVALLFLTGAWTVRATNPEEMDIDAIKQEIHYRRYADWISRGRIPMWVGNNYVELDSLMDVVDVAIDTDQRVIYDGQRDLFAVINGDVVYYYSKVGDWEQGAWPTLNLPSPDEPINVSGSDSPPGQVPVDDDGEPASAAGDDDDADGRISEEWDKDVWRNL